MGYNNNDNDTLLRDPHRFGDTPTGIFIGVCTRWKYLKDWFKLIRLLSPSSYIIPAQMSQIPDDRASTTSANFSISDLNEIITILIGGVSKWSDLEKGHLYLRISTLLYDHFLRKATEAGVSITDVTDRIGNALSEWVYHYIAPCYMYLTIS